ncbi:MAG: hypothetical protein JNM18_04580 [Planctomycetaceae bacterium]|nr:hypothetical protein [Planctomycetaceae bacterium]
MIHDPAILSPTARAVADYPGGYSEGFPETFNQLFPSFYGYIAASDSTASSTFPTFVDGHREVLLCEAVLRSACEGRWVDVGALYNNLSVSQHLYCVDVRTRAIRRGNQFD